MTTYRYKKATATKTNAPKSITIPESVKNRLCGVIFILFGILAGLASEDNGCYDITASLCLCSLGLLMVIAKYE